MYRRSHERKWSIDGIRFEINGSNRENNISTSEMIGKRDRKNEIAEGIFEIRKNSPGRVVIGGYRPLVDSFVVGVLFTEHRILLVDFEIRQVQGVVQAVLQIMRPEDPVQTVPDTIGILVLLKLVVFPHRHTFLGLRDKQIARRPLCRRSDIICGW